MSIGKHVLVACGLVILTLVAWTGAALAERRVALVVANAAYEGAPLSNPTVDLAMVTPALEKLGFDVTAVANADFEQFDAAINAFAQAAEGADLALFYFAGHGFSIGDGINIQNYLMSTSANVTSQSERALRRDGIPLNEIIETITSQAKTSLIFVDACRNDPNVRSVGGGSGRGLAPISVPTKGDVFVGLSTRLGDVAADGPAGGGSPFARAFVSHIGTPGLSVPVAFNKVRLAVEQETGMQQRPDPNRIDLADPEAIKLALVQSEPNVAVQQRPGMEDAALQEWLSIQTLTDPVVLKQFAEAYPNTRYAAYALSRIQALAGNSTPASSTQASTTSATQPPTDAKSAVVAAVQAGQSGTTVAPSGIVQGEASSAVPADGGKVVVDTANLGTTPAATTDISAEALLEQARQALEDGNKTEGRRLLELAAKAGSSTAMYSLYYYFKYAWGDPTLAAEWLVRSAEAGYQPGMYILARGYQMGDAGVAKSNDEYRRWMIKASEAGHPHAMCDVARMYDQGMGGQANGPAKSAELYVAAIKAKSSDCVRHFFEYEFSNMAMRAKTVRELQLQLKAEGHFSGRVDGDYGPGTKGSVQKLVEATYGMPLADVMAKIKSGELR